MRRTVVLALWLVLLTGVFWAPPARADLWPWIGRLMTGEWAGENLLVVAEFNLMGVWPVLFAALLRDRWAVGRLPALPFVFLSFFVGAYVLAPYFLWGDERREGRVPRAELSPRFRALVGLLGIVAAGLWCLGLAYGDVSGWWEIVRTQQFVCLMSCDFAVLWALFLMEARRRGGPWIWCLVPVVGAAVWLWLRPSD